MEANEVTLQDL